MRLAVKILSILTAGLGVLVILYSVDTSDTYGFATGALLLAQGIVTLDYLGQENKKLKVKKNRRIVSQQKELKINGSAPVSMKN